MSFAIAALLVLACAWLAIRTGGMTAPAKYGLWSGSTVRWQRVAGVLLIIAANAPLLRVTWPFSGLPPLAPGDGHTHAVIAQAIANRGLSHGWIDVYQGGFPFGPHYPSVGWLLSAASMKLGVPAPHAILWVGTAFLLLLPVLAWLLALRAGSRPLPAMTAALCLAWVSPANGFVGGWEAYWGKGVISQVVCVPLALALVAVVASRAQPWLITTVAVASIAAHPQVTVAAMIVLFVAVLASGNRDAMKRYARALLSAGVVGAAMFVPGILTLKTPLGWPPMERWLVVGYSPDRLQYWLLDGDLLDLDRSPVLTTLWAAALLVALPRVKRPAARAVVAGSLATMAFVVSGGALAKLGALGNFLLGFVQPLRFVSVVPIAMAATIVVAMEEAAPFVVHLGNWIARRTVGRRTWIVMQASALAGLAVLALPARVAWAREVREVAHQGFFPGACEGFDGEKILTPLRALRRGRLWHDDRPEGGTGRCSLRAGFEYASAIPLAVTRGAGAHVGVHTEAYHALAPGRRGVAERAEGLAVRYLLLKPNAPLDDERWSVVAETEDVRLWARQGGTDSVGVGCVVEVWEGSDAALRSRIFESLRTEAGADQLLSPSSFIELREGAGEVRAHSLATGDCDPRGASVRETVSEPGRYEAEIEALGAVDVVIRAAAFPTWEVKVDGVRSPTRKVGPGFFAARVGPGRHRVIATVASMPGYWATVLIALGLCAASAVPFRRWRRACHATPTRSSRETR